MKSKTIDGKRVYEAYLLKQALTDAGFLVENCLCCQGDKPYVVVYLKDAEAKDPTSAVLAYQNPPLLVLTSDKPMGPSGSPEHPEGIPEAKADGLDKHVVTIKTMDRDTQQVVPRSDQLFVVPTQLIGVNPSKPILVKGQATVEIGPSQLPGELTAKIGDIAGKLSDDNVARLPGAAIHLRFT